MEVDRPGPGEELHEGPATTPREAASVIVVRGGAEGLEVLLVQRNPEQRFMGGAWVFPGGALDPGDGEGEAGLRASAVRECAEEAAIELPDPDGLLAWSRWITPPQVKIRFDTWFFLAAAPEGGEPAVDGAECVDWQWSTPQAALDGYAAEELLLVFPTIKHLEQLARFDSADALLAFAEGREVEPVEPRVDGQGEQARVILPGEPGYEEAAGG